MGRSSARPKLCFEVVCSLEVATEWPDPFREGAQSAPGVLGSMRILSGKGNAIALVKARRWSQAISLSALFGDLFARQHSAMGSSLQL